MKLRINEDEVNATITIDDPSVTNDKFILFTKNKNDRRKPLAYVYDSFEEAKEAYDNCKIPEKFLYQPNKTYILCMLSASAMKTQHDHSFRRETVRGWGLFVANNRNQINKFLLDSDWTWGTGYDKGRIRICTQKWFKDNFYCSRTDWKYFKDELYNHFMNDAIFYRYDDETDFGAIDVKTFSSYSQPFDLW